MPHGREIISFDEESWNSLKEDFNFEVILVGETYRHHKDSEEDQAPPPLESCDDEIEQNLT